MTKLKAFTSIVAASICLSISMPARSDVQCPDHISQEDGPGGGGISGVGGGSAMGFAVWHYLNEIFTDTFPQLVQLHKDTGGGLYACVYDHHFGQTPTPRLVTTMLCEGGETIKWPYTQNLRVHCNGKLGDSRLTFEATYLGRDLMATMDRVDSAGTTNTEAVLIGH